MAAFTKDACQLQLHPTLTYSCSLLDVMHRSGHNHQTLLLDIRHLQPDQDAVGPRAPAHASLVGLYLVCLGTGGYISLQSMTSSIHGF